MFSLLTLLDDVATTLDDVAAMTKVAMGKTSALMSDDLAVNAAVVDGVNPDRELPMVKAIFIGSLFNKVYAIGGLFLLQAVYPPLITAILVLGGVYLSYEGFHKIWEKAHELLSSNKKKHSSTEPLENEQTKVKSAIKTDLILSIEIIVIAKSAITGAWTRELLTLSLVGLGASVIIYGLVALLVKIDDAGLLLIKRGHKKIGLALVSSMPTMMKTLGIAGTTAMLLVGGGIFHHTFHLPLKIDVMAGEHLINLVLGFVAGGITFGLLSLGSSLGNLFKRT